MPSAASHGTVKYSTVFSIQFLRGFAALLVLIEHLRIESGLVPYGAVGVDLFFVISGFIIFFVTEKSQDHFLLKRVIRIVPLYWLATFAIAALTIAKPDVFNQSVFEVTHLIKSLFFIPHYNETQGLRPLLSLGWTLNYEMMFYLIFAIAMRVSHKHRFEVASLFLVLLWGLANILPLDEQAGFLFFKKSIFLEFIFGMAIARYLASQKFDHTLTTLVGIGAALCLFFYVTLWLPTGIRIIDNGIPAAILFCACLLGENIFQRHASTRAISSFGGNISFALYLSHIYFIGLFARLLDLQGAALWAICFAVIPIAAWLIFNFIEHPMTNFLRRRFLQKS